MSEEKNTLKDHYNYLQKCLIKLEADNRHFNSLNFLYRKAKLNMLSVSGSNRRIKQED